MDACETEAGRAYEVNAMAVRHLAEAVRQLEAHLCHISTDYVFSGDKAEPYHEWDQPDPQSVYGASKLAGEQEAGPSPPPWCEPRGCAAATDPTSWAPCCGWRPMEPHHAVCGNDQRGSPSFTPDVAAVVEKLCTDRRPGLYHVTNQGEATWYEFAREVMVAAGRDPDQVEPVATRDLKPPRPAFRPANSVLENRALALAGIDQPADYRGPLSRLVNELMG